MPPDLTLLHMHRSVFNIIFRKYYIVRNVFKDLDRNRSSSLGKKVSTLKNVRHLRVQHGLESVYEDIDPVVPSQTQNWNPYVLGPCPDLHSWSIQRMFVS